MFDGGSAIDLGIVLGVREQPDAGGDAHLFGDIEAVKPTVEGVFGAGDGDFNFGAMEAESFAGVGGKGFLGFDGEADGFGFAFAELLEFGLGILVGGDGGFVIGEPIHLFDDLVAAFAEALGGFQFGFGVVVFAGEAGFEALVIIEAEEIEHEEPSAGKEDEQSFFAGRHVRSELRGGQVDGRGGWEAESS